MSTLQYRRCLLYLPALWAAPSTASAWQFHTLHSDPIAPVLLGVTGILFVALLGRFGARKLGLPSVLGELGLGILIGNLAYLLDFNLVIFLREGQEPRRDRCCTVLRHCADGHHHNTARSPAAETKPAAHAASCLNATGRQLYARHATWDTPAGNESSRGTAGQTETR